MSGDDRKDDEYRIEPETNPMAELRDALKQRMEELKNEQCRPDVPIGESMAEIATLTGAMHYLDSLVSDMEDLRQLDLYDALSREIWDAWRRKLEVYMDDLKVLHGGLADVLVDMDRRYFGKDDGDEEGEE
mgnify:FL=1